MSRKEERTETITFSADSNNAPPRAPLALMRQANTTVTAFRLDSTAGATWTERSLAGAGCKEVREKLRLRLTEMLAKCGLGASPASQECLGITRPGPFLRSGGGGCYPGSQNSQREAGRRCGQGKAEKGKPGKSVGRGAPSNHTQNSGQNSVRPRPQNAHLKAWPKGVSGNPGGSYWRVRRPQTRSARPKTLDFGPSDPALSSPAESGA
jgi:hypothetical protein